MSDRPSKGSAGLASLAELGLRTASLIHELRQPLFAIKGHLQRASAKGAPLGLDEVATVLEQAEHLEQVLAYYAGLLPHRDARGAGHPLLGDFDLRHPVRRAVDTLASRARELGVALDVSLPAQPVRVTGREMAVRQVALNLLHNALDAVAQAQGARRVVAARIRPSTEHGEVWLEIQDWGPGLPEDVRDRLFEPFVTTKGTDGIGLGLFIAQKLVAEVGGRVTLDMPPEGGTLATVALPLAA